MQKNMIVSLLSLIVTSAAFTSETVQQRPPVGASVAGASAVIPPSTQPVAVIREAEPRPESPCCPELPCFQPRGQHMDCSIQ